VSITEVEKYVNRGPFMLADGWYVIVNCKLHGPWVCKEYAAAGYQVEQRRVKQNEMLNSRM